MRWAINKVILRSQVEEILQQVKDEPSEDEETGDSAMVLDATAEFCRTLGDIPTYGLAGNRDHHAEIMVRTSYNNTLLLCSLEKLHTFFNDGGCRFRKNRIRTVVVLTTCGVLAGLRARGGRGGDGAGRRRGRVEPRGRAQRAAARPRRRSVTPAGTDRSVPL